MKTLNIFGSTGSIGVQTLNIVRKYKDKFKIVGLFAGKNIDLLLSQINEFSPEIVYISEEKNLKKIKDNFKGKIFSGKNGIKDFCSYKNVDICVIGISGVAGILPTFLAIDYSKRIALANKESLVSAGKFIIEKSKKQNVEIIPVDSEHSAIFQCLNGENKKFVNKIILTASGGPFFKLKREKFSEITVNDALNHPTWKMGKKITVDSATLMNKGLEIIEAKWLFNIGPENIEVLIHPQSIVHSMVSFSDGSIIAQLGKPSMEIPISYALFYPERSTLNESINLAGKSLEFFEPDYEKFPTLKFAYDVLKLGKGYPAALNMANEIAVNKFLKNEIKFLDIFKIIEKIFKYNFPEKFDRIEDVFIINEEIKKRLEK